MDRFYRPGDFVTLRVKKGGVITGTVTDSAGVPVIAARVVLRRVRDENGRRTTGAINAWQPERSTDDRGVYRFWGLPPGSYLVSAGGKGHGGSYRGGNRMISAIEDSVETYHPSATTPGEAVEVRLQEGHELTGIDIRHRDETGHAISGHVSMQAAGDAAKGGVGVMLIQAATGTWVDLKPVGQGEDAHSFIFDRVADGEYYLKALRHAGPSIDAASVRQRVVVNGKDVTGVELRLAPLGSVEGRLTLEPGPETDCRPKSAPRQNTARLGEALVIFRAEGADYSMVSFMSLSSGTGDALGAPDDEGKFTIGPVAAMRYRAGAQLPNEDWYISSITLTRSAQSKPADVGRDLITIRSGERITGLTIAVREGAASVRGRVTLPKAAAAPSAGLSVHLMPAEPEHIDNLLRFTEAGVESGESKDSFHLTNIAPGRYYLLVRPRVDASSEAMALPVWDREARAKLVREAVAANNLIELKPCQKVADRVLTYAPPAVK